MNELHGHLQRARSLAPAPGLDVPGLMRREERRARIRRIGTAALSLAIGAAAIAGTTFAFRVPGTVGADGTDIPAPDPPAILALRPGEYAYTQATFYWGSFGAIVEGPNDDARLLEYRRFPARVWVASDGSGRLITPEEDSSFAPGTTLLGDVSSFSSDPAVLLEQLVARSDQAGASPQPLVTPAPGQGSETGGVWRAISDLIESGLLTPHMRAALFEVAAALETATRSPAATDPVGRPADLVELVTEGIRHELWVEPRTRQPLALRDTWLKTGQVSSMWIVERAGVVGSTDDGEPQQGLVTPPIMLLPTADELLAVQPGPKGSTPAART